MRPLWIVGYARTGSHVLSGYLNATGLFDPEIDERMSPSMKILPFPAYSVVHSHHFSSHFSFSDKSYIEESLPGLRYIWLKRRDLVATTVSTFIARKTKIYWTKFNGVVEQQSNIPVEFDESLFRLYCNVCARDKFWESYFTDDDEYITIYYENMDLPRVFEFLDIDQKIPDTCGYKKFHHPMTGELCQILQDAINTGKVESTAWTTKHFEQSIPLL